MTRRFRPLPGAAIAFTALVVVTGCSRRETVGIEFGGQHTIAVSPDGRKLDFAVPTCKGKPTVRVIESRREVHLLVTSNTHNRDKCGDLVSVTLRRPLGTRAIVDDKTDQTVATESTPRS